jgi:(2Fe-2S) ferredoxin
MASRESAHRIKESTSFLLSKESKIYRQFLHPTLQTGLDVIAAINNEGKTYEQIADIAQVNRETAKQFVQALIRGGAPIVKDRYPSGLSKKPDTFIRWDND